MTHLVSAGTPYQLPFQCFNLMVEGAPSRQQGLNHQPQLGLLAKRARTLASNRAPLPLGRIRPKIFIRPRIWLIISVRMPTSCCAPPRSRARDEQPCSSPRPRGTSPCGRSWSTRRRRWRRSVDLHRQGRPGVTGIQAHRRQREGAQLMNQPGAAGRSPARPARANRPVSPASGRLPRARSHSSRADHQTSFVDDAHRGLGLRDIRPAKVGMAALRFGLTRSRACLSRPPLPHVH